MTEYRIHVVRLAVTMTRDQAIHRFLFDNDKIKSTLLYIGVPIEGVSRTWEENWGDPLTLTPLLNVLHQEGMLASFLTEMLRAIEEPDDLDEFLRHLLPLGLDLDGETGLIRPTTTHPEAERILRTELDGLLNTIDSDFPERLRGSWEAYYSKNPDRYRQAVASCRELMNDVTQRLGGKGSRQQRVRQMLDSESRGKVIDASVNLVEELYGLQSAQEHDEPDHATALFVLIETEHILYFLLTRMGLERKKQKAIPKT